MPLNDAVIKILRDALEKGHAMRNLQKRYFVLRDRHTLEEAKRAEREFDEILAEAGYALTHGEPMPKQMDLF